MAKVESPPSEKSIPFRRNASRPIPPMPKESWSTDLGAIPSKDGVRFRIWAPKQASLSLSVIGEPRVDFSLVDPDNRKPVDFDIRKDMLKTLKEKMAMPGSDLPGFARGLLQEWRDGSIKLYVTFKSLNYRKENRRLFMEGAYLPLQGDGALKEHICAFARQCEGKVVLAIVPRFLTRLVKSPEEHPLGHKVWGDSWLVIPPEIPAVSFNSIFTAETIGTVERDGRTGLALDQVFANFPVAMLEAI